MRTKTVVIYARVSSIGDRQSTDRQVKDLTDYAVYQKMEVRKVFEEHISGAKRMMSDLYCVRRLSIARKIVLMSFSSANCRDWAGMRLRFLPLSRICLTVASTFISKRSSSCFLTRKQTIFVCSCHDSDPFHLCSVGT